MTHRTGGQWCHPTLLTVVAIVLAVAIAAGAGPVAAQTAGPSTDCVGSGSGAAYQTDSGLTVYETDTDATADRFYFTGDDTIRFEYQSDAVNLSAAGNAAVQLADGTGDTTCLGAVDAADHEITVEPDDGAAVTLEGTFEAVAVGPVDASAENGVDLSYDASDSVAVTVNAAALDDGTEVIALDEDGSELAETTVEDGRMRFDDLPAGEYRIDLAEHENDGGGNDDGGNTGGGNTGGDGDPGDGGTTDDDSSDVTVRTANVSRTTVETGETVTVNATLATTGDRGANDTIVLRVGDVPVRNETLSVPAEGTQSVTLTHTFDDPGEYALAIGTESVGPITVESEGTPTTGTRDGSDGTTDTEDGAATNSPASSPTDRTTGGSGPGFDLTIALVAIVVLVALALVVRRRRQ